MDYRLGTQIGLKEARVSQTTIQPGDTLVLALDWQASEEIDRDYTVFTHLLSAEGELVAQQDNKPLFGVRPTFTWRVGELLEDPYRIQTESDLKPGLYSLAVGMYDSSTIERLPAFDGQGNRLPDDRIVVTEIKVVPDEAGDG